LLARNEVATMMIVMRMMCRFDVEYILIQRLCIEVASKETGCSVSLDARAAKVTASSSKSTAISSTMFHW
jgi:hypothetical protein